MSSASSPERGQCVPNTSQTVRSRWKRAFPSWSVRFAYTACTRDFGTLQSRIASDESRNFDVFFVICFDKLLNKQVCTLRRHDAHVTTLWCHVILSGRWHHWHAPLIFWALPFVRTNLTCGRALINIYIYIKDPLYNILINVLLEKKYGGEGGGVMGGAPSKSALGPRTDGWITQNHAFNSLIRPDHEFCTWICPDRLLTGYAGVPLVTWIVTNLSMPWISNYIHQFKLQ